MSDILHTYHGQLYVNLTNRCPFCPHILWAFSDQVGGSGRGLILSTNRSVEKSKTGTGELLFG